MRRLLSLLPSLPLLLSTSCMELPAKPAATADVDEGGEPPRDVYVVVPKPDQPSAAEGQMAAAGPPPQRTFYLNRGGGTYTSSGYANNSSTNTSSIVDGTVTIGAYQGSEAQWNSIVACVREQFAPWNVEVTDVDPGSAVHLEAVVGGHPSDLGYSGNVGGVAPLYGDCTVVERAIGFVFADIYGNNTRALCETIAHEIGHSVGLDHEYMCEDPMTYLYGCGDKAFQDVAARCGEYEERDCRCGPTQNSVQVLTANLGAGGQTPPQDPPPAGDTTAPAVSVVSPVDGDALPADQTISVTGRATDDVAVAKVELLWTYSTTVVVDCDAPPAGVTCSRSGEDYTFSFAVGSGARSFAFRARDASGNVATSPTVSITLGQPPEPPPADSAPTVTMTSPSDGAGVAPGATIEVRASAADDGNVDQVRVVWGYPGGETFFYLYDLGNGTWGVNLRLGSNASAGARTLYAIAADDQGNQSASAPVTIQVQ